MTSRPISVTRFERKLRAIAGAQGSTLLPGVEDLIPLIVLEQDRPEWARAGGEELLWGTHIQGQLAGERSIVGVRNPAGTGMLAIIEQWETDLGAGIWALTTDDTALVPDTQVPLRSRDLRAPIANQFSALSMLAYNVPAAGREGIELFKWGTSLPGGFPIILPPNARVLWSTNADNAILNLSVIVRALPLEGSILG